MINAVPIIGWAVSLVANISLAVPFWVCWTYYGIGGTYFYFLPTPWQAIPFWNCVGLFLSIAIIKTVFVPKLAFISQSADHKA